MPSRYPHDHETDVIHFAQTNFRNALRKFGIKTDDRRRHMYVIGKTGMGKSTLLENMILADIYAGHGCCYIDPHGDTAGLLIDHIPSWRINDVVYFNPSDADFPIGFNILESVDPKMKNLVAAALMSIFKKIWENVWSARMEYILNNTILALLDTPGTTLLGVNRMLSDKDYRLEIVRNIKDPIVKQFWVQEFAQYDAKFASEAVAPIQNKVGQFLSSSTMRNIVAQAKSSINIREIMDDQKILIINLSKGRVGEDAMRLLGGMLITKIQVAAMERVDTPEKDRNDFYMYVDEFQNFAVESFASILSEARKYRLNLIMAHQYIAQLSEEVRDAVFGNVGTMITFRVGSPDATFMESEFMPRFTPEDLINLPKFAVYLKLMIDGVTSNPFSAFTLPPIAQRTDSTEKVIQQSRERYAGNREHIEEHVARWSGFGPDVDLDAKIKEVKQLKDDAKKMRFGHTYECTRCGKSFQLPVELDRSRPIYCEECKPIIDAERQKAKARGGKRPEPKVVSAPVSPKAGEPVLATVPQASVSLAALKDEGVARVPRQPSPVERNAASVALKPEVARDPLTDSVVPPMVLPDTSSSPSPREEPAAVPMSSVSSDSGRGQRSRDAGAVTEDAERKKRRRRGGRGRGRGEAGGREGSQDAPSGERRPNGGRARADSGASGDAPSAPRAERREVQDRPSSAEPRATVPAPRVPPPAPSVPVAPVPRPPADSAPKSIAPNERITFDD